jgi:hypothetical protein
MLQQIIRCFPFPSPRNSPRPFHKKSISRTISNDPSILTNDQNPNKSNTNSSTNKNEPSNFSASLNNQSAWQLRKKQFGHLLQRVVSHEAPEGNLETSSSAATLFHHPSDNNNKEEKRGALGKLCKVGEILIRILSWVLKIDF